MTSLLWLNLFGLSFAVGSFWLHYDELVPFSWKTVFESISIAGPAIVGLSAFVSLVISLLRHEPYLLIYDDRIEMPRLLSKNNRVLFFSDVKDLTDDGDRLQAVFELQPFIKKSDLPPSAKWLNLFGSRGFRLSLTSLSMPADEVYDMMLDRFLKYKK